LNGLTTMGLTTITGAMTGPVLDGDSPLDIFLDGGSGGGFLGLISGFRVSLSVQEPRAAQEDT
jgi:hypothetical protein